MGRYVKDPYIDRQIARVKSLLDQGYNDDDIAVKFQEDGEKNQQTGNAQWTSKVILEIRTNFNLDEAKKPDGGKDLLVRKYSGSEKIVSELFQKDSLELAKIGYRPVSQNWIPGSYGFGSFIMATLLCFIIIGFLVFIYMMIVKPDGSLTVTFERESKKETVATKTCPQCAEEVKAAAKICRFCQYQFPSAESTYD